MSIQKEQLNAPERLTREEKNKRAIQTLSDADLVARYYTQLREDSTNGTLTGIMSRDDLNNYIGFDPDLRNLIQAVYDLDPKANGISTDIDSPVEEEPNPEDFIVIQGPYVGPDGKERILAPKYLPKHVHDAYTEMNDAYLAFLAGRPDDGTPKRPGLIVKSGYRSPAYQTVLALRTIHEDGLEKTLKSLLPPGYSQHGRIKECAIDILMMGNANGVPRRPDGSPMELDETIEGAWLLENAEKYGFWLPFYPDPADPTSNFGEAGIVIEPWHYQFIGEEKATENMAKYRVREVFAERHRQLGVIVPELAA